MGGALTLRLSIAFPAGFLLLSFSSCPAFRVVVVPTPRRCRRRCGAAHRRRRLGPAHDGAVVRGWPRRACRTCVSLGHWGLAEGGGRSGASHLPLPPWQRGRGASRTPRVHPHTRVGGREELPPLPSHREVRAPRRSDAPQPVIVPPCPAGRRPSLGHERGNVGCVRDGGARQGVGSPPGQAAPPRRRWRQSSRPALGCPAPPRTRWAGGTSTGWG